MEHLKFTGAVFRDNIYARLGGTACARADYQSGTFPLNFPIGGFTFKNNLLFLAAPTAPVDSLHHPLATTPGWFSGAEFDTTGQAAGLRFSSAADTSPFADPDHAKWNFALQATAAAGRAGYLAASDGGTIGAWQIPRAELASREPPTVQWISDLNLAYQAQSLDDMAVGGWKNMGDPVAGDGSILNVSDPLPHSIHRYYRVTVLP